MSESFHIEKKDPDKEDIRYVDATPDDGYPIRILEAHLRGNENLIITDNTEGRPPENPALIVMNEASEERAKILRRAIAILSAQRL